MVFSWSIYNGSTYYIDVFGKRFQKELEAMKAEVSRWQNLSDGGHLSPFMGPQHDESPSATHQSVQDIDVGASAASFRLDAKQGVPSINAEQIPLLDNNARSSATEVGAGASHNLHERNADSKAH